MTPLLICLEQNPTLINALIASGMQLSQSEIRSFPDGDTYLRIPEECRNRTILVLCALDQPDAKVTRLLLLARTLRQRDAAKIILIAPYLAYMRQDKIFHPGESLTSHHFAALISDHFDALITVDPHLHRIHHLNQIFSIPAVACQAAPCIAKWIAEHVQQPLLIGPDEESQQWVESIASYCHAPFVILQKTRTGDRQVEVSVPQIAEWPKHTPILLDDIISTGQTMMKAVKQLQLLHAQPPICIGVHAIFAGNAWQEMQQCGATQIVTCNTVLHESNRIELSPVLLEALGTLLS